MVRDVEWHATKGGDRRAAAHLQAQAVVFYARRPQQGVAHLSHGFHPHPAPGRLSLHHVVPRPTQSEQMLASIDHHSKMDSNLTLKIFVHIFKVCWYWKMLTESDQLWMPKCLRFGWNLNYIPSSFENGIWKQFYIENIRALQYIPLNKVRHVKKILKKGCKGGPLWEFFKIFFFFNIFHKYIKFVWFWRI